MRAFPLAAILALTVVAVMPTAERAAGADRPSVGEIPDFQQLAESFDPPASRIFPIPPGFGSFGANGPRDRSGGIPSVSRTGPRQSKPTNPPASPKPLPPQTRAQMLDDLFNRLAHTNDADEARGIALAIERVWMRSGSDTADLLMRRAMAALGTENYDLAQRVLDAVVVIAPTWSEGWDKRATARFFDNDYTGAMEDIGHVLAIEPRHFGALAGMGFILEKSKLNKEALQVFRKTLEIYPQQSSIRKIVDALTLKVEGRDI
jgi:hypothetical protein